MWRRLLNHVTGSRKHKMLLRAIPSTRTLGIPVSSSSSSSTSASSSSGGRLLGGRSVELRTVEDEYSYLESPRFPARETLRYLRSERAFADGVFGGQSVVSFEARIRAFEPPSLGSSSFEVIGEYVYIRRPSSLVQIRRGRHDGLHPLRNGEAVVDFSRHGPGYINKLVLSTDHRFLAYTFDKSGAESYSLHVVDIASGDFVCDPVPNVYNVVFSGVPGTLVYTTLDSSGRPFAAFSHTLFSPCADSERPSLALPLSTTTTATAVGPPELLYSEADPSFLVDVGLTKDALFVCVSAASKTSTETRIVDAGLHHGSLQLVQKRVHGLEYFVEHRKGHLYIVNNAVPSKGNQLSITSIEKPGIENWERIAETGVVDDLEVLKDNLIVVGSKSGFPNVRLLTLGESRDRPVVVESEMDVNLPIQQGVVSLGSNLDPDARFATVMIESPLQSPQEFSLELSTGVLHKKSLSLLLDARNRDGSHEQSSERIRNLVAKDDAPVTFDVSSLHVLETHMVGPTAEVPLTVVRHRDTPLDGTAPVFMTVYGAYGISHSARYEPFRLPMMQDGWIFALAHVRGGSELGPLHHEFGRQMHKKNTFHDLITCAEWLVRSRYCQSGKIVVSGHSAGGMAAAAVLNMRPELFSAAILNAPFVDVLSTVANPELPFTIHERDEWGNADDDNVFRYIKSYCPYQNIRDSHSYPPVYVSLSLDDRRVPAWGPLKYFARIKSRRAAALGKVPDLLQVHEQGGHFVDLVSPSKKAREMFFANSCVGNLGNSAFAS
ncbi:mitochondrial peptidase S9 family protein (prolyl oligopeptidase) [Andalucia godoyi]|uniref:Prolyl endopeptidase n=1 Tax=Andalucia godoyi TaxID=505711 RepID=A0A8K0F4F8_ANDGO|nr:mitochondrial peptidase S9 family protein (prolyl oligopeptidase) [Andalucia godoyi]|eukprot:ANDGO_06503.mRNA.1 mitochondrial peptidase S9 family protein (prolyl oligopeptidase)